LTPPTQQEVLERLERAPVSALPAVHKLLLPTPFSVGPVQIYLVEGDPLTLVDTGVSSEPSRAFLEASLDCLGYSIEEIGRVVLTHYHADHLGQAQALRDAGVDFELLAHEAEAPMIETYAVERDGANEEGNALFRDYGVPQDLLDEQAERHRAYVPAGAKLCRATHVDRRLRDGDAIAFKDFELRVIHAPGHTAGHLLLHEARTGTLFTGDHIMGDAVPYTENYYLEGELPDPADPLRRRPRFRGLPAYLASLRRLRKEHFQTILPAHGGVIRVPKRAIEDGLLFYDVRVRRIERGLRTLAAMGQPVTGWDLWGALFPKADPLTEMRSRMLMVIGALDVLEADGACVAERRDDGVLVHRHVS